MIDTHPHSGMIGGQECTPEALGRRESSGEYDRYQRKGTIHQLLRFSPWEYRHIPNRSGSNHRIRHRKTKLMFGGTAGSSLEGFDKSPVPELQAMTH